MSTNELGALLASHQEFLQNFALRLTKSREESNDLTQETFYKALIYSDKFEEGTNLKGWLCVIMKNSFINNYRRNKRQNTFTDDSSDGYYINLSVQLRAEKTEELADIDFIMKQVNSVDKQYIEPFMMHFNGFQYEEIAEIMAIPLGTVKSRIFMARKKMQRKLEYYR